MRSMVFDRGHRTGAPSALPFQVFWVRYVIPQSLWKGTAATVQPTSGPTTSGQLRAPSPATQLNPSKLDEEVRKYKAFCACTEAEFACQRRQSGVGSKPGIPSGGAQPQPPGQASSPATSQHSVPPPPCLSSPGSPSNTSSSVLLQTLPSASLATSTRKGIPPPPAPRSQSSSRPHSPESGSQIPGSCSPQNATKRGPAPVPSPSFLSPSSTPSDSQLPVSCSPQNASNLEAPAVVCPFSPHQPPYPCYPWLWAHHEPVWGKLAAKPSAQSPTSSTLPAD